MLNEQVNQAVQCDTGSVSRSGALACAACQFAACAPWMTTGCSQPLRELKKDMRETRWDNITSLTTAASIYERPLEWPCRERVHGKSVTCWMTGSDSIGCHSPARHRRQIRPTMLKAKLDSLCPNGDQCARACLLSMTRPPKVPQCVV